MELSALDPAAALPSNENTFSAPDLGRNEFLELLVAKLENQDPLKPSEDAQFVAELATFSSLEQLIQANDKLDTLNHGQLQVANSQAWNMIGKGAVVDGTGSLQIRDGQPDGILYAIPRTAKEATLEIRDSTGNVVREFELETAPRGAVILDWAEAIDGEEPLPDGVYEVDIQARDTNDQPMIVPWFQSLHIDAISFFEGNFSLISHGREIPFESILEIREGRN